jgi:hypothetical protein
MFGKTLNVSTTWILCVFFSHVLCGTNDPFRQLKYVQLATTTKSFGVAS